MDNSIKMDNQNGAYQFIMPCSNDLFIVGDSLRGGQHLKYGVVNNKGVNIIPFSFISISEEIGKYFRVRRLKDDKTAILDMYGNVIIDYGEYHLLWPFWGSYLKVKQNNCYGLLDSNLNIALSCKYSNMFECIEGPYRNCYGMKQSRNDCWHYMDNNTLQLIP